MAYQPTSQGPWLRGLVASNQPLSQPKGSFPRGSNLVMIERGGLTPCDGSGAIDLFGGTIWGNPAFQPTPRGKLMAGGLFEPTGVNPYFLVVAQNFGTQFGAIAGFSGTPVAGGSLVSGQTYWYKVTAIDGVGGETIATETSATPAGANLSVKLTWNTIPNAFAYNIYRGLSSGTETLLSGGTPTLPVVPSPGVTQQTWTDNGTASSGLSFSINFLEDRSRSAGIDYGYIHMNTSTPGLSVGAVVQVTGANPAGFNGSAFVVDAIIGTFPVVLQVHTAGWKTLTPPVTSSPGGTVIFGTSPPLADTTQQTVLYQMASTTAIPIAYSDANIVAFWPAAQFTLGQVPSGGSGGVGTTGPGISGRGNSTPSGGIAGLVGPLPQLKQFLNLAIIALGNGYPPQAFWDSTGTTVNPAPTGTGATGTLTASDQVTVNIGSAVNTTDPTKPNFIPVGSSVTLSNFSDTSYDGTFQVIAVSGNTFVVRNTGAGAGPATGGTWTVNTTPIINNYQASYPVWNANESGIVAGDIFVPKTQPGAANIYLTCVQSGNTGNTEPSWPVVAATGQQFPSRNIAEFPTGTPAGSAVWVESGYLTASPLPGAAHIEVYAGSLWAFNTSPVNNGNGLDGPTALRMSNTNNLFAWNPVNQAFLDKDNGQEGMALGKFTITAQGIPPEGSLIAFKYRVPYQIIGVFGANNFAIQPVSSDMGCMAPRSVVFVPGFGLMRYTHLGIAVFDGWKDTVNSEQIRPYLFPVNDFDTNDIVVADANNLPLSWGAQTANPPMYAFAMPIGNSGGKLTRIMLFDLVLKCWAAPTDVPFPLGFISQAQPVTSNPLTIIGGFSDGALQRWQAGDIQWYTTPNLQFASEVAWNFRTTTVASQQSSQRLWCRKVIIRGTGDNSDTDPFLAITVQTRRSGLVLSTITYNALNVGDFEIFADVGYTGLRFDAVVSGTDHLEIDGVDWAVEPRPFGVQVQAV